MKLLGCLLALFLVSGCFEKPQPPPNLVTPQPTVQRLDGVLRDTADDLELGAKVRTLVYEQDSKRSGKVAKEVVTPPVVKSRPERKHKESIHNYTSSQILFGVVFLLVVVLIRHSYYVGCLDAK